VSTEPLDGMSNASLHKERYGEHEHARAAMTKKARALMARTCVGGMVMEDDSARGSQPGRMSAGVLVHFEESIAMVGSEIASDLERIDELITQGDLLGAWRLLEARRTSQAGDPGVSAATGRLLRLRGRHIEARALLEHTLRDAPDDIRVQIELAHIARDLGERDVAHAWFERAYRERTEGDEWVLDWLGLLCGMGRFDFAGRVAAAYSERVPGDVRGWFQLGFAYQLDKRHDLALGAYEHAMRLDQSVPMLRNNMAAAYLEVGRDDNARTLLESVLREEPGNALAWTNLAMALLKLGDPAAAQVAAERACALAPDYPVALQTCANVLSELQEWDRALYFAQRAAELEPGNKLFTWTLAMLQLLLGDYAAGWRSHEARWEGSRELSGSWPALPAQLWSGQGLAGKTLFVWGEQGFGDVLQFVRFLPLLDSKVRQAGGKLVFCCLAPLLALVRRSLGDQVQTIVAHDQPHGWPAFDYQLPLASLPLMLDIKRDQLPVMTSYLQADHAKAVLWRSRFAPGPRKLRVGLVWTGSRTHQRNRLRAIDPLLLASAFGAVQGVDFVSVQVGASGDVKVMRDAGLSLTDPTAELASFDDTAALLQSLDLVITVCTSVAHLAGALGVRAWVLLDVKPHWVWMTGRRDSPWYPSIRLYRQHEYGQWNPVLAKVACDLAALAETRTSPLDQKSDSMTNPNEAIFQSAFDAYHTGRVQEAEADCRQALAHDPRNADALHLLGLIHAGRGGFSEAAALIGQAVEVSSNARFLSDLGDVLRELGRLAEAEATCRRAIELAHDYAPAYFNLGTLFMGMGHHHEAEQAFRHALTLDPNSSNTLNNLALLLGATGRAEESEAVYRRVIANDPGYVRAPYNLGLQFLRAGRFGDAEQALRHALTIAPNYADAQNDLGTALREQNRYDEAEAAYRNVLQQHPDFADARWNLAILLLLQGRYAEGWPHAEARYHPCRTINVSVPNPGYPQWQGESLAGKSLVLWHEQGFGDAIQFARYAPLLKALGLRRLTLLCPAPLKALMETLDGVDEVVCDSGAVGPHDFWSLTMSVPLHAGTTTGNIPASLPYLHAQPDRARCWRARLPARRFKVGLVWKGSTDHQHDAGRSLPGLLSLAPLWSVPGVTFVSLQKGQDEDEPARLLTKLPMVPTAGQLKHFADTAALVSQLDLVITVDTSVAHLAGALGKPCWLLLHTPWTDWRWMHERTDSPWYPQVLRLFRQTTPGDWAEVIGRVVVSLDEWVNRKAAS
jgi:tetratricopeptide (TPR) repeat protein